MTTFLTTDAPGYHGDTLVVYSAHRTREAAMKKRGGDASVAVYAVETPATKGAKILRCDLPRLRRLDY